MTSAPKVVAQPAANPQPTAIALLQSSSLPTLVQKELERMILAGDLAAGAKLNEVALAELLGVSRGPVRESFRALVESGLVRQEKNRGVFVRQISVEEADEIFEVRALFDEWAGRRVAQTVDAEQVKELRAIVERMERAAAKGDVDAYHALNLEFHDRLIAYAGNAKLLATYRRLVNELNLYRRQALAQPGALPFFTREHRDIVAKIASRNAAAAGKALRDHVLGSRERMHRNRAGGASSLPHAAVNAARQRR
jgi:phosphonate utilization transcriptional regulator